VKNPAFVAVCGDLITFVKFAKPDVTADSSPTAVPNLAKFLVAFDNAAYSDKADIGLVTALPKRLRIKCTKTGR